MSATGANSLTPRQQRALMALLAEPTIARAAEASGVGERSLRRWLAEPAFSRAFRAARREAFGHAISLTQKYAPTAVATLTKVMTDPAATWSARVSAATSLLRFGRDAVELDDLEARLTDLEQSMGSGRAPGRREK